MTDKLPFIMQGAGPASVAVMVADTRLQDGDRVRTQGYFAAGDGGSCEYDIGATGTTDGVVSHTLANGLKAFPVHGSVFNAEWAGAVNGVESSNAINKAWVYMRGWQDTHGGDVTLVHSSSGTIKDQIIIQGAGGGQAKGVNLDFSRSSLTAVTGGNLSSTTAMMLIRIKGDFLAGNLDGGRFAAGYDFYGCTGSRIFNPNAVHVKGFAFTVRGASGAMVMTTPIASEYLPDDDEFNDYANFTAIGLDCQVNDWTCITPNIKWFRACCRMGNDAVGVHVMDPHFVTGNPNADGATVLPFADGVLIENYAPRTNHFTGGYFDNGLIHDYTGSLSIRGGHFVKNDKADFDHPYIRVYATEVDQGPPIRFSVTDLGGKCSIGFLPNGSFTWAGDWDAVYDQYPIMDNDNNTAQSRRTEFNLYPATVAKIEYNYKPEGLFRKEWQVSTLSIAELIDPENGVVEFEAAFKATELRIGNKTITAGIGSPEGVVTAVRGSLFLRGDGGAGTTFYVKESGTGNTGWVGK